MKNIAFNIAVLFFIHFIQVCTYADSPKEMFENRCSVCHSINPPPKLAPPFRGIVHHYSDTYPEREEFAKAVAKFVTTEDGREVKMPGAVNHFGEMPVFPYNQDELIEIAHWIWDNARGESMPDSRGKNCAMNRNKE